MKISKYIVLSIASFTCIIASAQTTKNDTTIVQRDVTIEREYNPVIMDAKKVNQSLVAEEPNFEKKQVTYSNYEIPLSIKSASVTIPQAPLTAMERYDYKNGYARLAIGAPLCWNIDFAYPIINKNDMRLNFAVQHVGTWWMGEKNKMFTVENGNNWAHQQKFDTRGNLNFAKDWRRSELYMDFAYQNRAFNYYGTTSQDSTFLIEDGLHRRYQRFNNVDFTLGYKSLPSADFFYDAQLSYNLFGAPTDYLEHQVGIHSAFDIPLKNKKHHIAFTLGADGLFYNRMKLYSDTIPSTSGVIEFSPAWRMVRKNLHLNVGLKAFFALGRNNRVANIAPDVELEYFIKPEIASFYVGATGDYKLNSMRSIYATNLYTDINTMPADVYTPLNAHIGVKLKPISHLYIDAFARYQLVLDELLFTNNLLNGDSTKFSNTFTTINSDWQEFSAGVHINYNYKDRWDVYLKAQYNGWWHLGSVNEEEHAWYHPAAELTIGGDVNITSEWRISASYYLAAVRYAKVLTESQPLRNIHDVNLSLSYSHSNWLTAYVSVENLLGMIPKVSYQDWYGYDRLGAAKLGVIFSF